MRNNESTEDIYNSLPLDLFTNDMNEYENDSLGSELEDYNPELEPSQIDVDSLEETPKIISENSTIAKEPINEFNIKKEIGINLDFISDNFSQLSLETKPVLKPEVSSSKNNTAFENDDSASMWIRCVRCGKKNEFDCNFCGKCGLQIHKTVSIVEPEAAENLSPEVSRNIKYHYKRPVFCFSPRGNCFASFSSPSKSVRNVTKFPISSLVEFRDTLASLLKGKVITKNSPHVWGEKELKDIEWNQADSILKDITVMIAAKPQFILDESLRHNLREYFASISPKDLGSIKMLATQDNVSYLRGEIDQIFHLLVIGKTMEACELSIKFNYWDHALIIAKTLDLSFYETVMNRFLDSRFANGHPLRILYLIMTNNEKSALEEIRNMINNNEMPMFVQEIWMILINFLLRAKHESITISNIFEDIANCLFDRKLFENSLVCYIISVLSGPRSLNPSVVERIDYLLAWFTCRIDADTINFASIHILNVLVGKIDSMKSNLIMWRSQFIRLIYSQFLHDFGQFSINALSDLSIALDFSKKYADHGFPSLLVEECSILEGRNMVKLENKQNSPVHKSMNSYYDNQSNDLKNNSKIYPESPMSYPAFEPALNNFNPLEFKAEEFTPPANLELSSQDGNYSPVVKEDIISESHDLSPKINNLASPSSSDMMDKPRQTSIGEEKAPVQDKSDNSANVFGKLKSWLPISKSSASNQENQKQVTKAKMGKPNSFRYDEKLKKWVDDNDPSTFEEKPKLPPPPTVNVSSSPMGQTPNAGGSVNFRAKKGKVKYFDPLNPDGPSSTQLQPSVPNFN